MLKVCLFNQLKLQSKTEDHKEKDKSALGTVCSYPEAVNLIVNVST